MKYLILLRYILVSEALRLHNNNNFVYSEISDYILTLIDYVNYAWADASKLAIKKKRLIVIDLECEVDI
jgi:hypothetical protein